MPYIIKEDRKKYVNAINELSIKLSTVDNDFLTEHLTYIICSIIKRQIDERGITYSLLQNLVGGVLTCSQLELYRRFLIPYKNEAFKKNGDI